jgi:hypothetical protein
MWEDEAANGLLLNGDGGTSDCRLWVGLVLLDEAVLSF